MWYFLLVCTQRRFSLSVACEWLSAFVGLPKLSRQHSSFCLLSYVRQHQESFNFSWLSLKRKGSLPCLGYLAFFCAGVDPTKKTLKRELWISKIKLSVIQVS